MEQQVRFIEDKLIIAKKFKEDRQTRDPSLPTPLAIEQEPLHHPQLIQHYDQEAHTEVGELFEEIF